MASESKQIQELVKFSRLADYIAAAQIFLKDNVLLEKPLEFEHIKPRLLGHWGTVPGITALFGQILRLAKQNSDKDFLYVVGPGHGFPGYQAGLFIEGSLSYFYPKQIPFSKQGLTEIIRGFSSPYKYPSHLNPEAPGVILEGGELGYSLSTAFGSVIDEPELITVTLIGDGETETGPLMGSYNLNKLISPKKDGAVLPVLHLNGYKISGPTIFGRMEPESVKKFYEALGYDVLFAEGDSHESLHKSLLKALDKAVSKIRLIQEVARSSDKHVFPKWPLIVTVSPKGMGGPQKLDGKKIEDNCASHQVVFDALHESKAQLQLLQDWLSSYRIDELISFDKDEHIILDEDIKNLFPVQDKRIGANTHARRGAIPLKIPSFSKLLTKPKYFGEKNEQDSARIVGRFFKEMYKSNKNNFRLFSPDETYSNHLDDVFKISSRAWQLPVYDWDKDLSSDGRVFEILSEHALFGMLSGYTLTGRTGVFASYESFAHIVSSMADQYIKFIKIARNVHFRKPVPSLNILLTSLIERQDHNGFSHQNPSFISNMLNHDFDIVDVYFPVDANVALFNVERALENKNKVSVFVLGKRMKRIFTTPELAKELSEKGIGIFPQISDPVPDIVVVGVGDYITQEAVFGTALIRETFPDVNVRFVNINRMDIFENISTGELFNYFTADKPVIFNYHGYSQTVEKLLFAHVDPHRVKIEGYSESGSTTTPFDMLSRNKLTRYHILKSAAEFLFRNSIITRDQYVSAIELADCKLDWARTYAKNHLDDPEELKN